MLSWLLVLWHWMFWCDHVGLLGAGNTNIVSFDFTGLCISFCLVGVSRNAFVYVSCHVRIRLQYNCIGCSVLVFCALVCVFMYLCIALISRQGRYVGGTLLRCWFDVAVNVVTLLRAKRIEASFMIGHLPKALGSGPVSSDTSFDKSLGCVPSWAAGTWGSSAANLKFLTFRTLLMSQRVSTPQASPGRSLSNLYDHFAYGDVIRHGMSWRLWFRNEGMQSNMYKNISIFKWLHMLMYTHVYMYRVRVCVCVHGWRMCLYAHRIRNDIGMVPTILPEM
jgi:hypothetical protein